MRGLAWLLGLIGIVQFGVLAYLKPHNYVSVDMAYLVMWLLILAGVAVGCCSCWGCGWVGSRKGCECCGDDCDCGDCECCEEGDDEHAPHEHGEHGHQH